MDETTLRQLIQEEASRVDVSAGLPSEVRRRALRRRQHRLAIVTAVGVLVAGGGTALAVLGAPGGTGTRLAVVPEPSRTDTSHVVPWVDRAAQPFIAVRPVSPPPAAVPRGTPACTAAQLRVSEVANPGYTQSDGVYITVRNAGTRPCVLHGYPAQVFAVRADGRLVKLTLRHESADLGRPNDKVIPSAVLRSKRDTASLLVDSQRACITDYRSTPVYWAVEVELADGSKLHVNTRAAGPSFFACGPVGVGPFVPVPLPEPSPAGTFEALTVHIAAPSTVSPGQLLKYTVTIANSSARAVSFHSCPSYQEAFYPAAGADFVGRYQLNCDTVHAIPARGSVRYAMQLPVPANASGTVKFTWFFLDDVGPDGATSVEVSVDGGSR
jgi:Protein of unknown function (DUF4232)